DRVPGWDAAALRGEFDRSPAAVGRAVLSLTRHPAARATLFGWVRDAVLNGRGSPELARLLDETGTADEFAAGLAREPSRSLARLAEWLEQCGRYGGGLHRTVARRVLAAESRYEAGPPCDWLLAPGRGRWCPGAAEL